MIEGRPVAGFAHLAPPGAVLCEAFGGDGPDGLYPDELARVATAVPNRRREFALGRTCARRGLARLGYPPVAIPAGPEREPVWPAGVVGSITHCRGYCAAVVARVSDVAAVGIDAEPNAPLPRGLLDRIAVPGEREQLDRLAPGVAGDRLLFCLKETVYKVWYPLAARWLGFGQARIDVDAEAGTYTVTPLVDGPRPAVAALRAAHGRFAATADLLCCVLAVAQPPATAANM